VSQKKEKVKSLPRWRVRLLNRSNSREVDGNVLAVPISKLISECQLSLPKGHVEQVESMLSKSFMSSVHQVVQKVSKSTSIPDVQQVESKSSKATSVSDAQHEVIELFKKLQVNSDNPSIQVGDSVKVGNVVVGENASSTVEHLAQLVGILTKQMAQQNFLSGLQAMPMFNGELCGDIETAGELWSDWLDEFDLYFGECSEEMKCKALKSRLAGEAKNLCKQLCADERPPFNVLVEQLTKGLVDQSRMSYVLLRMRFNDLCQKPEQTVRQFIASIEKLARQAYPVKLYRKEDVTLSMIDRLLGGLIVAKIRVVLVEDLNDTESHVNEGNFEKFRRLCALACQMDENHRNNAKLHQYKENQDFSKVAETEEIHNVQCQEIRNIKCENRTAIPMIGHVSAVHQVNAMSNVPRFATNNHVSVVGQVNAMSNVCPPYACWICHKYGHFKFDCPLRRNAIVSGSPSPKSKSVVQRQSNVS
jgi:hypothetical protein